MNKLYNFKRLIKKYSVKFEMITQTDGAYINGHYQEGKETVKTITGALVPLSENKLTKSGGTYTAKDKQLYLTTPITSPLKNTKIRYKGQEYSLQQETDHSDYADAYVYMAKWVSAFD